MRPERKPLHHLANTAEIRTHGEEMLLSKLLRSEAMHYGHNLYRDKESYTSRLTEEVTSRWWEMVVCSERELSPTGPGVSAVIWKAAESLGCGTLKEEGCHWEVNVKGS